MLFKQLCERLARLQIIAEQAEFVARYYCLTSIVLRRGKTVKHFAWHANFKCLTNIWNLFIKQYLNSWAGNKISLEKQHLLRDTIVWQALFCDVAKRLNILIDMQISSVWQTFEICLSSNVWTLGQVTKYRLKSSIYCAILLFGKHCSVTWQNG